ncbi:hypothetical protein P3W85_32175 [Cupriavidus basilensis]|uniref:Uncharacterized protein n=1 Tax=Cupriavidus basilensis TaxID=68895 RepID=A0ABT6AY66_9BURK|nr:hypothetical protein [Cupriavidus basilensis]MDF3837572.1 hypothetical protein [Cupriavidus basilensis]
MSELQEEVQRLAAKALADFNDRAQGRLDFSEESLQVVEEMLAEASEYRDDLPSEAVEGLVTRLGCYTWKSVASSLEARIHGSKNEISPCL